MVNAGSREIKSGARCVMWSSGPAPAPLMAAMHRRGVEPRIACDAFSTMAEIVAGGSLAVTGAILLLVEPAGLRGKRAMLTSCRRYAPGLRVWVYQSKAAVKLRPLDLTRLVPETAEEHAVSAVPPARPAPPKPQPRMDPGDSLVGTTSYEDMPVLKLAGAGANGIAHGEPRRGSGGLLSDEELAMLLADEYPDD
jgi:hypothetical protein